jgi:hypothetical protein
MRYLVITVVKVNVVVLWITLLCSVVSYPEHGGTVPLVHTDEMRQKMGKIRSYDVFGSLSDDH